MTDADLQLALDNNEIISWLEPDETIYFMTCQDAVTYMTTGYIAANKPIPPALQILCDFVVIYWAELSL